jgi:sulfur carrier protein
MNLMVNGEDLSMEDDSTVADVVERAGHQPSGRGIAVAVNGIIVPRADWATHRVLESDKIEVLAAIGGG